jgi:hypothetical protein
MIVLLLPDAIFLGDIFLDDMLEDWFLRWIFFWGRRGTLPLARMLPIQSIFEVLSGDGDIFDMLNCNSRIKDCVVNCRLVNCWWSWWALGD